MNWRNSFEKVAFSCLLNEKFASEAFSEYARMLEGCPKGSLPKTSWNIRTARHQEDALSVSMRGS